jgi:type I restriction enzyme S subunit
MNDIARAAVPGCPAKGWAKARLGEIADINPAIDISDLAHDLSVSFVPMPAVEALTGHVDTSNLRSLSEVSKGYTRFKEGDVLFAKITPCMENGKIAIANSLSNGLGFGSTEFHVIRSLNGVSNRYIFYYLLQDSFRDEAEHNMKGTAGQRRVPADFLTDASLPIPPSSEQQRIVAKIDELSSELDAGVVSLQRAKALLKKYRQAVLKAAVTGELTRDWRERHRGEIRESGAALLQRILKARRQAWEAAELKKLRAKAKPPKDDRWKQNYKEPQPPDTTGLPTLPEGWVWASVEQLAFVESGQTPRGVEDVTSQTGELPWFKVSSMTEAGNELAMTKSRWNLTRKVAQRLGLKSQPKGTIVFPKRGGAIPTNKKRLLGCEAAYDLNLMGLVPVSETQDYLWIYFQGVDLKRIYDGSNVPQINYGDVAFLSVPLSSLREQVRITEEIDARLSTLTHLEAELEVEERQSASLRQSILKAAFAGRLVPQDPNDEPASVLLERIRAERAARPRPTRGRRRKTETAARQLALLR